MTTTAAGQLRELLASGETYEAWALLHRTFRAPLRAYMRRAIGRSARVLDRRERDIWNDVYQALLTVPKEAAVDGRWLLAVAARQVPALGRLELQPTALLWPDDADIPRPRRRRRSSPGGR